MSVSPIHYANTRDALFFSAKRDVMSPHPLATIGQLVSAPRVDQVRFGAHVLYQGPFDDIKVITDYGVGVSEETSNTEIKDRFKRVLKFWKEEGMRPIHQSTLIQRILAQIVPVSRQIQPAFAIAPSELETWVNESLKSSKQGVLGFDSISDIPGGNADFMALTLLRLGGEKNRNIFIHVCDPGVGVSDEAHDRTILVTGDHGIYVGPNNGSLGLIYKHLQALGESPRLLQIDFDKIEQLERIRLNNPDYKIPVTIHGRDVFAVAAALIAAGVKPEAIALKDPKTGEPKLSQPVLTPFTQESRLPESGETITAHALRDNTFGNLKLNIPLDDAGFAALLKSGRRFQAENPKTGEWLDIPLGSKFSDVLPGELVLYHGSSPGVRPGTRNLEIARNLAEGAEYFGIGGRKAEPLRIRSL